MGWTHFTDARGDRVEVSPVGLDTFTACPRSTIHVVKVELALATHPVGLKVKLRDDKRQMCIIRELVNIAVDVVQPLEKVCGPGAYDVI